MPRETPRRRRWLRRSLASLALAASSGALVSACSGDATPADDVALASLSNRETLALCDELRDAVSADDRPIQCGTGERYWLLPSNQFCLDIDRSTCGGTVGELRRCHAQAVQNPCAELVAIDSVSGADDCQFLDACGFLMPQTARAGAPDCTPLGLAALRALDGIYELSPTSGPFAAGEGSSDSCLSNVNLPVVIEPGQRHAVLASTDRSGTPELIVQGCDSIDECRALASPIRAGEDPRAPALALTASNRFIACEEHQFEGFPLRLRSTPPDLPLCLIPWAPEVQLDIEAGALGVNAVGPVEPAEASRGCGSVTAGWTCGVRTEYRTTAAAPL